MGPAECQDGIAAVVPGENVDLAAFVPLEALGRVNGSDIWGWEDPLTRREYAVVTTGEGPPTWMYPADFSVVVGILPAYDAEDRFLWRGVKVYADHAFVSSEIRPHGMQVFDLTRLRNQLITPVIFTADTVSPPMPTPLPSTPTPAAPTPWVPTPTMAASTWSRSGVDQSHLRRLCGRGQLRTRRQIRHLSRMAWTS